MNVPLVDLQAQYAALRDKVRSAVDEVFESQKFILGTQVVALEKEVAAYSGVPYAVGVASGTDALFLSLKAIGAGPGDGIVTTPYTFFATAGAIVNVGARPLFVDIDEASYNLDPDALVRFLERDCTWDPPAGRVIHRGSRTRVIAILPVHLYGQCAEMDTIMRLAARYGLKVIEDACQAIGAGYGDARAGTMGDLGCFSFFPSKNLGGAGDGGMVISRSEELAGRVRLLRGHGAQPKYYHAIVGFNSRLDELQAAVLRVKLPYLERWSEARRRQAEGYERGFKTAGLSDCIRTPQVLPRRKHIFHQYVIRCRKRDELQSFLKSRGISTEIYYPRSLHEQECFSHLGYAPSDLPRAHAAAVETLALPMYPELTDEQRSHVVSSIADFYRQDRTA